MRLCWIGSAFLLLAIGAEDLGRLLDALLKDIPATLACQKMPMAWLATGVEIVPFPTPQSVALFGHLG